MRTVRSRQVVCLIAMALLGAACTSGAAIPTTTSGPVTSTTVPEHPAPTIAVDLSVTPAGWVPVAYGDVQISVPADWIAVYGAPPCSVGHGPGEVFVNPLSGTFACPAETGGGPSTLVDLGPVDHTSKPGSKVLIINGIAVREAATGGPPAKTYIVPSLGVQLTESGTLGSRVLHTLSRSARDIALRSGQAPTAPASWHRLSFAGFSIAVPRSWPVISTSLANYPGCVVRPGVLYPGSSVVLDTDKNRIAFNCPALLAYAHPFQPSEGIRIDKVLYPPLSQAHLGACFHLVTISSRTSQGAASVTDGLSVCPATSPAYSILMLKVTASSLRKPVYVSIGLAGNGMVARTILYSLRAA
jgi:hypothetical protein